MRWKTTLILLAATVGLGAYLSLYEIRQPPPEERARLTQQIVRVNPETVTQLTLTLPQTNVTWQRDGATWRLTPQQWRADPTRVQTLLSLLRPLLAERTLTASTDHPLDLPSYRLDPAIGSLSVTGSEAPVTLRFGEATAVGGNRYARVDGRPEVFVIPAGLFDAANQPVEQFRDPVLLRVDPWHANGLTVTMLEGSFTLTRSERMWQVASSVPTGPQASAAAPWTDVADRAEVNSLLQRVGDIAIARFLEEPPQADSVAGVGLDQPQMTLVLQQQDAEPVTVVIGAPLPDDRSLLYATRSDESTRYAISQATVETLSRDAHGLRSKRCFDFFTSEVTKVEVGREQTRWLIQRSQDQWKAQGEEAPLDQERVEQFLDELGDLSLSGFVDDAPASLSAYGLEPPAGTISVWTIGEAPVQRLLVGSAIDNSSNRYGRIDGRPAVVRLPEAASDLLAKTLESLRTPAPSQAQPALHPIGTGTSPPPAAPSK